MAIFLRNSLRHSTVLYGNRCNAKTKGKCTIYVYAQNGVFKGVKITVK